MQYIKQLRDGPLFMDRMICLYTCLYDRFEVFRDELSYVGLWVVRALKRPRPLAALKHRAGRKTI